MRKTALLSMLFLLASCGGYKKDVETICNVRSHLKLGPEVDAMHQQQAITGYLITGVHSPKAKRVFSALGSMSDEDKVKLLRKEAAAEGVSPCPLADEAEAALKTAK